MKNKIQNLITQSRKEREYAKLSAYQAILSGIQSLESLQKDDVYDSQILKIIQKEGKIFQESADLFRGKNRSESRVYQIKSQICADLYADMAPKQIDPSEYDEIVTESLQKVGAESARDMGKVMLYLKKKFKNSLDMKVVSGIVREKLNKN